jgi:colanic acid/amylovoran biosynthesis glycosyltransferase
MFPKLSETFILNQITGLIDRGFEVDIFAGHDPKNPKTHPDVNKYNLSYFTYYRKIPSNKIKRVIKAVGLFAVYFPRYPKPILRSLNIVKYGREAFSLKLFYSLMSYLRREPYDIIHCQFGIVGRLVLPFHDIDTFKKAKLITHFRGRDISWFLKKYGESIYKELFEKGDFFLTNSEYFKRRLIKLGCNGKKISVQYSGIDCKKFSYNNSNLKPVDRIRILTIGRLVEKKGVEYAIRAIAKLNQNNHKIEYVIVGDGPLKKKLQRLTDNLHVSDIVIFVGWKDQTEVIEMVRKSHILLAPSVTASDGDQEGPVNSLKEAMAIGLPVIGTQHGGIPELIVDGINGFLVPERDPDTIAERLEYLLEHPNLWEKMGREGRRQVEKNFDIEKLNNRLVKIYQGLMEKSELSTLEI